MKKLALICAAAILALALAGPGLAAGKTQTTCPVLAGNLDKNLYVDYQGYRIYFCCSGCDTEFKKNPEKYLKKMQDAGITPEKSPAGAGQSGK